MKAPSLRIVFNRNNTKNKSGMYSIHLRITIDRRSKYFCIPVVSKISESEWNYKNRGKQYVKNTHPYAFEINNKIEEVYSKAYDIIRRYYSLDRSISFDEIFDYLGKKGDRLLFNNFVENYINNPKEAFKPATITKYKTFLLHLNNFKKDIYFRDICPVLVSDFKSFLEIDLNLAGSTIKSYFDKLKKVIAQAEKESYLNINQTKFLFDDAKVKVNKPKRTFLEIDEIKRISSLSFSEAEAHLRRNRDLFLFQIYTGYYYKDLKIIKKEHLKHEDGLGAYLLGERDKNGNVTIIPLYKFPNALKILTEYESVKVDDEYLFDSHIFIENQTYNRQLKEIAEKAKIKKNIYNKVARHTNAQLWIRFGAAKPILSKMLGHQKEDTTNSYYEVGIAEVEEGIKNVNFNDLGI